jgi:hypothetical protein
MQLLPLELSAGAEVLFQLQPHATIRLLATMNNEARLMYWTGLLCIGNYCAELGIIAQSWELLLSLLKKFNKSGLGSKLPSFYPGLMAIN